ncbi:hypothetical protein K439DRAFT_826424 [Ramaria rubella]|nr:hypothetical protein K439DRAFT_826424 [Ramaria rubella]
MQARSPLARYAPSPSPSPSRSPTPPTKNRSQSASQPVFSPSSFVYVSSSLPPPILTPERQPHPQNPSMNTNTSLSVAHAHPNRTSPRSHHKRIHTHARTLSRPRKLRDTTHRASPSLPDSFLVRSCTS